MRRPSCDMLLKQEDIFDENFLIHLISNLSVIPAAKARWARPNRDAGIHGLKCDS